MWKIAGQESIGHFVRFSLISFSQMSHWLAIRDFRFDLPALLPVFLPVLPLLRSASVTKLLSESETFRY